jgi:hypothetical protein
MQPDGLPQPALHAIPDRRFAQCAGDGKADFGQGKLRVAIDRRRRFGPFEAEGGEQWRIVSKTLIIDFSKVTAAKYPSGFGKAESVRSDSDSQAFLE